MAKKSAKKTAKKAAKKPAKKAVKKSAKKAPKKAAKKAAKKAPKKARKAGAGLMQPYTPSAALAAVVGDKAMPRTEVVKKMWAYIRSHKLQDQKNKRMINSDAKLQAIFNGNKQVSMFDMNKFLSKHLK